MFSLVLFFPLFFFIFLLLNSEIKPKFLTIIGFLGYSLNMFIISSLLVITCILNYSSKYIYSYQFFNWSSSLGVDITLNANFDYISIIMSFTVILVATMVNLFSIYYMANDPNIVRFFSYLSLFTFCMLLLVNSNDLVQFFIGWELVGLCSYLLINFWYTRKQANVAAMKAVLVNRVGDFFLLYAIALIYSKYNTLIIQDLASITVLNNYNNVNSDIISISMFIAVMSKSAQFGLHSWLPDAMEGPTPVSALIHAATMVTAGIFLMLKMANLFSLNENILNIFGLIGAFTAVFGATTGFAQTDIKKIIAFSTCSQLGYMVAACGMGYFSLAFFHLITHAFFKSLLFLCAGVVIHTLNGEQDIRKMGLLVKILPTAFVSMTIAGLTLSGVPFLSGFYSKELIINIALIGGTWYSTTISIFLIIAAIFTSLYSAKLIYYIFLKKSLSNKNKINFIHKDGIPNDSIFVQIPLTVLSIFSIFGGFWLKDPIIGLNNWINLNQYSEFIISSNNTLWVEYTSNYVKIFLIFISLSGFITYTVINFKNQIFNNRVTSLIIFKLIKLFDLDTIMYIKKFIIKINYTFNNFFFNRWFFDYCTSYFFNYIFLTLIEDINLFFLQATILDKFSTNLIIGSVDSTSAIVIENSMTSPRAYVKYTYISLLLGFMVMYITDDMYHFNY